MSANIGIAAYLMLGKKVAAGVGVSLFALAFGIYLDL